MAATPDFSWSYDLVARQELVGEQFNTAMTALESYINALKARLDILDGAVTPTEYVTDTDLDNHVNATAPHKRMVKFASNAVLTGSVAPADKVVLAQQFSGTIVSGGSVGVTFSTPYTGGGVVGIFVTPSTDAEPLAISAPATNGVTVVGANGTAFHGIVWGWY